MLSAVEYGNRLYVVFRGQAAAGQPDAPAEYPTPSAFEGSAVQGRLPLLVLDGFPAECEGAVGSSNNESY